MAAPLMASPYDRKALTDAAAIRDKIITAARNKDMRHGSIAWMATAPQLGLMNGLLGKCFGTDDAGMVARHEFLEQMFGNPSSKALSMGEASAVIDWVKDPDGDGPHPAAVAEAWLVLKAWGQEHGQMEMEL
jgi:hypothetical protein